MTVSALNMDPITFEVIKHRLWQINDEQAIAIKTISSSPIVVEGNDFNVGLFTKDGQLITAGFGSTVHVGTLGTSIRNIIRKASHIRDGDMFLTNDPFMGALHHNDVVIASPLFWEGEILLWVGNVLHHPDVGGIDEGSFCINARNLYQEPPRYFLKIVDQGVLVPEIEYTFVTNSRLPDMVALDLRAQIGAIHVAKCRLASLINEIGPELVEKVMHLSLTVAEKQIREHFRKIPDGEWSGEAYMDGDRVGSERIVKVKVRAQKTGDRLLFDYTGSDPQVDAAVNCTYHATVAGTAVPLYSFLCGGHIDWNEAVVNCIEVIAPEGTVTNAKFPAPVSICTIGFRWLVTVAATQAVAKMFNNADQYRHLVCPSWVVSSNCNNLFATYPDGRRVGGLLSDHRGGGAAARSFADGYSHAGQITSFASNIGNVESTEWKLPLLYLYRRQLIDSGGPGAYRGGLTAVSALVPYGVHEIIYKSTNTAGTKCSNASGINGGYPGAGSQVTVVRNSQIWRLLQEGEIPLSFSEFHGDVHHLPSKADGILKRDDVFIFYAPGGGGYGDPLNRDPEHVKHDVLNGWVSQEMAEQCYGVVFSPSGEVDFSATEDLRGQFRQSRKQGELVDWAPSRVPCSNESIQKGGSGSITLCCKNCQSPLTGGNRKVSRVISPLKKAGPWLALHWLGESPDFVLEEIACPSCGTLLSVQELRKDT